ncbi:ABC transporter permease [Haloprofundus salilacus]|uniref:ABC transporter permease n=1 Tax=Haloprofundus salilacus TaxID=2876190 RepID=UPI001CCBC840|nr:ABC transporter permease [Haloprofundus salilacus]
MSNVDSSEDTADDLPFKRTAESQMGTQDRLRYNLDSYLLAPFRVIWTDMRARVGFIITTIFILLGTVGVWVIPQSAVSGAPRYVQPFNHQMTHSVLGIAPIKIGIGGFSWTYTGIWKYPFGTDALGQDVFTQVIHSTPVMLKMILAGAVFSVFLGTFLGTLSGFKGGLIDRVIMTLSDIIMTIPGLPLVIIIAAAVEPSNPYIIGLILGINNWPGLARAVRSEVLSIREREFVEASRTMGISTPTIMKDDIIPDIMSYVAVNFVMGARGIIFESVGLYFLGILPFTTLNWGVMMNLAYTTSGALYTWQSAHWLFIPMITITVFSLGLMLFAQGLDRLFNPRVRARHVNRISVEDSGKGSQPSPTETVQSQGRF